MGGNIFHTWRKKRPPTNRGAMFWIGWFVFSFIAGVIADSKGRSGIGVFFVSVLLSPLVGIIYAIAIAPRDKVEQQITVAGGNSKDYRKCPHCAEAIRREATKCRYCGSEVEPAPYNGFFSSLGAAAGEMAKDIKTKKTSCCPYCNAPNAPGANVCNACHKVLRA